MSSARALAPQTGRSLSRPEWQASPRAAQLDMVLVTISVTALALSQVYGFTPIVVFLAATFCVAANRPARSARDVALFWPLLILPIFALFSTLWSDAPERTLRAGLQLLLTVSAAIIICRRTDPRNLVTICFFALALSCATVIPPLLHTTFMASLYDMFGSKNAFTAFAVALIGFGSALVLDRRHSIVLKGFAVVVIALSSVAIAYSNSAGGKASAIMFALMFIPFATATRLSPLWRGIAFAAILLMLLGGIVFANELEALLGEVRQSVLNRDATLTGRTYLWSVADGLMAKRPVFGYGYFAFWRIGNIDAEGLWRYFGIANRTGFNFHNTFIEMRIDLGLVGAALLIATVAGVVGIAGWKMLRQPSIVGAFFLAMTLVIFIRSFAESGLIAPFYPLTLIWVGAVVYGVQRAPAAIENNQSRTSAGRSRSNLFVENQRRL